MPGFYLCADGMSVACIVKICTQTQQHSDDVGCLKGVPPFTASCELFFTFCHACEFTHVRAVTCTKAMYLCPRGLYAAALCIKSCYKGRIKCGPMYCECACA